MIATLRNIPQEHDAEPPTPPSAPQRLETFVPTRPPWILLGLPLEDVKPYDAGYI